nr:cell division cycle protein 23 homolog [Crassostrea gigas]
MKHFFLGHIYLELQLNEEGLKIYQHLMDKGFVKSSYIVSQVAMGNNNMREVDMAVNAFTELTEMDPYRLENMDYFSNTLYIKEMRADLAHLANRCCDIDKYREETCVVIERKPRESRMGGPGSRGVTPSLTFIVNNQILLLSNCTVLELQVVVWYCG